MSYKKNILKKRNILEIPEDDHIDHSQPIASCDLSANLNKAGCDSQESNPELT